LSDLSVEPFSVGREGEGEVVSDEEPHIRRAVSSFVKTVWEEEVDEKLGSLHKPSEKDMERMVLAGLLVKWAKALDDRSGDMAESKLKKVLMEGDNPSGEKSLSYLLPLRIKGGLPWLWRRFGMRSILSATGKTTSEEPQGRLSR
jgi:hypothetical protein